MKFIKDKDQLPDVEDVLDRFNIQKLDIPRILSRLLDSSVRRYISNIKDNGTLDTLTYMATWQECYRKSCESELKPYIEKEEQLTADELEIKRAFEFPALLMQHMEENHLDFRISIKGFRSKQIADAVSSNLVALQKRQDAFTKAFTPQEKIK